MSLLQSDEDDAKPGCEPASSNGENSTPLVIVDGATQSFSWLAQYADPVLWRELTQMVMGPITYQDFASLYADQHRRRFGRSILSGINSASAGTLEVSAEDAEALIAAQEPGGCPGGAGTAGTKRPVPGD